MFLLKLKKLGRNDFIIIALLGVMLLVVAIPSSPKEGNSVIQTDNSDMSEEEVKLKETLEQIEGVGRTTVMITGDGANGTAGVLIVTEGADNTMVKQQISEAVSALFGIEMHKIIIVKMSAWEDEK